MPMQKRRASVLVTTYDRSRMRALFFPVILVALAGLIGAMTATAPSAGAARQAVPCATVAVLASRGSGDTLGQDKGLSAPGQQFATHLAQLLGGAATPWANPYPAVGVFSWPWQHMSQLVNGLGAATKLSGLGLGAYHDSVVNGETKLASEIKLLESSSCATTPLVLVGYSQGAQVTADVYQRDLTDAQRQMVAAIVLFGDPYFNATNKTVDRGSYSGRRNGLLGTRPTFPTNERTLILSYCHSHDPICQGFYYRLGGTNISFDPATIPPHQHTNYTNFNEPQKAAQQIANALAAEKSAGSALLGRWDGTGTQFGCCTWTINMAITTVKVGEQNKIDYPTLDCGGTLTVTAVTKAPATLTMSESITYAKERPCFDGGTLRIALDQDGALSWRWSYPDGRVGAVATLRRQ